MQAEDLTYGRFLPPSFRTALAAVVSQVEETARNAGGVAPEANQLDRMLDEAIAAIATLQETDTPDVVSITQAFGVATIVVLYDKDLDPAFVPAVANFAITDPARTITGVSVAGRRVSITYSGTVLVTADAPLLAYTQVAGTALRDFAGLKAADYTATAVTVAAS